MFKSKKIGSSIRRAAAVLVLGGVALTATAPTTEAQVLSPDGKIYATASCSLATRIANVNLTVMNPSKFASSGLVYYVKFWAKARWETNWTLLREVQTGTIKTIKPTSIAGVTMNDPTRIFSGSFAGARDGIYDIYFQYWYRVPTSSTWAGMFGFNVSQDPHSYIETVSNDGFGNLYSRTSDCNL
jgi:hypothetical protein